jgi:hypothetical protein
VEVHPPRPHEVVAEADDAPERVCREAVRVRVLAQEAVPG